MTHDHNHWLSAHVFLASDDVMVCDRLILDVAAPFVRQTTTDVSDSYFVVRYGELGPHLRVRVRLPQASRRLAEETLETFVAERYPAPLLGRPLGTLPPDARPSRHASVVWVPYTPEVTRYGGPQAIEVAEAFFRDSTAFTFLALRQVRSGIDRFGIALAAMVSLLASMTQDVECASASALRLSDMNAPRNISDMFARGFARQASTLTDQVSKCWSATVSDNLPDPLVTYAQAAVIARTRLQQLITAGELLTASCGPVTAINSAITMLVPSYMHMTNNRLGLDNLTEAYLGYVMRRALAAGVATLADAKVDATGSEVAN